MPSRAAPCVTRRIRDPNVLSIRGAMRAHALGLALLLAQLSWSAGSQPESNYIEILSGWPLPDQPATLPLHIRFRLSAAGRAVVAVDGFVARSFSLTEETGLEGSISLAHLSPERHLFAIDLLAPDGSLRSHGPRWEVEIAIPAAADGGGGETDGWEVEACETFDPEMTEEERGRAETVDGWLLVRENIEFTTLVPPPLTSFGFPSDPVYVYVVPWSEFPIVPSYPHFPLKSTLVAFRTRLTRARTPGG